MCTLTQELQHSGPTSTDVNPAAGRQQPVQRVRDQGGEPEQPYEQPYQEEADEGASLGAYEASV